MKWMKNKVTLKSRHFLDFSTMTDSRKEPTNALIKTDPIYCYGGPVHHMIELGAKAEGKVVKGLEGNNLRKY